MYEYSVMAQPATPVVQVVDRIRTCINGHGVDVDVSAVVRDRNGQRVVRLRPKQGSGINRIMDAIGRLAPLAQVASLTSEVDGSDEVELRLPTRKKLLQRAFRDARSGCLPWFLWKVAQALIVVALGLCATVIMHHAPFHTDQN